MSSARVRPTRDETRHRLFDAAARTFAAQGIGATSIEDICREAGLTRGAVYSNFSGKDELVMAMLDHHLDQALAESTRLLDESGDPGEYLRSLETQRLVKGPLAEDPVLHLEILLYIRRTPALQSRLADYHERWMALVAASVEQASAQTGIDLPAPIDEIAPLVMALDEGFMVQALFRPGLDTTRSFTSAMLLLQDLWIRASAAGTTD